MDQINQPAETTIATIEPIKLTVAPKKPRKFIPLLIIATLFLPAIALGGFYLWTKSANKQNKNSVVSAPQRLGEVEFPEPAPKATYATSSEEVEYESFDYPQNYSTGSSNESTEEDIDIMIEDDFLDDSMFDDFDDLEDFDIDF